MSSASTKLRFDMDNEFKSLRSAILANQNKIMRSIPITMPEGEKLIINSIVMAASPEHVTEAKIEYFIRKMTRKPRQTKATKPVSLVKKRDYLNETVPYANKKGHVQEAYMMDSCRKFTSHYKEI